jgi:hypothetical protein
LNVPDTIVIDSLPSGPIVEVNWSEYSPELAPAKGGALTETDRLFTVPVPSARNTRTPSSVVL